ncbi:hypothetical protein JWG45_17485 [Leptospira sp. 201903070]|uniref:Uncharacterized protein n=1 Tax=Leptospira ainlahdjerensis TaxID=2810033 RepID=A0ABS2UEY2_9LEPT|nr:hypothetical protein [Leptospira ainlahdjerensis]MBM9578941.1 hypothetical protein [Leptospira ainlahdjerensis]
MIFDDYDFSKRAQIIAGLIKDIENRKAEFATLSSEKKEDLVEDISELLNRKVVFKVGDKVRLIESLRGGYEYPKEGEYGIIQEIYRKPKKNSAGPFGGMPLETDTGVILVLSSIGTPLEFPVDLRRFEITNRNNKPSVLETFRKTMRLRFFKKTG